MYRFYQYTFGAFPLAAYPLILSFSGLSRDPLYMTFANTGNRAIPQGGAEAK